MAAPSKSNVTTVKEKGAVVGWGVPCSKCGKHVEFSNGRAGRDSTPEPPDDTAQCWDCYQIRLRQYREARA